MIDLFGFIQNLDLLSFIYGFIFAVFIMLLLAKYMIRKANASEQLTEAKNLMDKNDN